jgi:hypothetical protein
MALANMVGGDKLVLNKEILTSTTNMADKSLCAANGTYPASATNETYGVVEKDTKSGDDMVIKTPPGIFEVIALGSCTKGSYAEVLTGSVYANIDGTSTSITAAGVQNATSSNNICGKFHSTAVANETVLVELFSQNTHLG